MQQKNSLGFVLLCYLCSLMFKFCAFAGTNLWKKIEHEQTEGTEEIRSYFV